jgi:hypothetical protein
MYDLTDLPRELRAPRECGELTADGQLLDPLELYQLDLADWVRWAGGDPSVAAAALAHARTSGVGAPPAGADQGGVAKRSPTPAGPVEGFAAASALVGSSPRTLSRLARLLPPPRRGQTPRWASAEALQTWFRAAQERQTQAPPEPLTRPGGRAPRGPRPHRTAVTSATAAVGTTADQILALARGKRDR